MRGVEASQPPGGPAHAAEALRVPDEGDHPVGDRRDPFFGHDDGASGGRELGGVRLLVPAEPVGVGHDDRRRAGRRELGDGARSGSTDDEVDRRVEAGHVVLEPHDPPTRDPRRSPARVLEVPHPAEVEELQLPRPDPEELGREGVQTAGAEAPPEDRAGILAAVERYRRDLEAVGMSDRGTYRGMGTAEFLRHVAGTLLLGAILVPFALVGIATSIPPLLVIFGLGKLPVSPAVKATLKPAAALVLFPLAWGVAAWRIVFEHLGPIWTIVAIGLVPLYLVAGIVITERVVLLWRALRAWRGRKGLREAAERIAAGRAAVVAAVATRSDDPAASPG